MARYRKIDPRIWNDAKFRALTDSGKLAFLFVLTHPHMTAVGAMRATVAGLAAELDWTAEAFREAFREALSKGLVRHDEKACFVWLPNFLRYNAPESPNVVKAWVGAFDLLPECAMKFALLQTLKDFTEALPEGFTEAFRKVFAEAFAKGMPYPEQEQEQEQEQEPEGRESTRTGGKGKGARPKAPRPSKRVPESFAVTPELRSWAAEHTPHVDLERETKAMRDYEFRRPYSDWPAVWRRWMTRASESQGALGNGRRKTRFEQADDALERWREDQRRQGSGFLEGDEGALRLPLDGPARGDPVAVVDPGDRVDDARGGEARAALAADEREGAPADAA